MNSYTENITASMENSRNCLRRIARNDDTEFSHQSVINAMEKFVKSVNVMDETILIPCRLMDMKVGDDQDQTAPKHSPKKHTVNNILNSTDLFDMYNMLNNIKADLLWGQGKEETAPVNTQNTTLSNSISSNSILSNSISSTSENPPMSITFTNTSLNNTSHTSSNTSSNISSNNPSNTSLNNSSNNSSNPSSNPSSNTPSNTPSNNSSSSLTPSNPTISHSNSTSHLSAPKGHIRRPSTVSVASTNSSASSISDNESDAGNENDSGIEESNQAEERTQQVAENFRRHLHGLTRSLRQMTEAAQYLTTRYQHDIGGSPI